MRAFEHIRAPALAIAYQLGGWPRRVAALICLLLAGLTAVDSHAQPAAAARSPVVLAARDLGAGTVVRPSDITLARWPAGEIPPKALRATSGALGATIGAGVDRGEPITSARLSGTGIAVGMAPGLVAVTVAVAGPGTSSLIRPGNTVDLIAAVPADAGVAAHARVVAPGVRVLAVLPPRSADPEANSTGLVVAVTREMALSVASVADGAMTATLRMPP